MKITRLLALGLFFSTFVFSCLDNNQQPETISDRVEDLEEISELESTSQIEIGFVHSVYFWLEYPSNEEDHQLFMDSMKKFLDQSPYIISYHIGTPAGTPREVVDNSYHYCLIVNFENKEAHEAYQVEDAHQVLRDETAGLWSKLQIYDTELIVD